MATRAFVTGCAGTTFTQDEIAFIRSAQPWGLILFRRNIEDPAQVASLTSVFRDVTGRTDAPVLIDQEGGRVQRLRPPHWPSYPAGRRYGDLLRQDRAFARDMAVLGARLMAFDLHSLGITVDCLPVLDVPVAGADDVIGDRAYADEPGDVAFLGAAAAEGLLAGAVLPVMKHIPGHGRAEADSHLALPVVTSPREELDDRDFLPFRNLSHLPAAMTAHVVFTALDDGNPATTSRLVVQDVIRGRLGFGGLLFTDDLSMNALSGSLRDRAEAAFAAGCDIGLHCNGDLAEMRAVAEAAPELTGLAAERAERALSLISRPPEPFDVDEGRARFAGALAAIA